MYFIQYMDSDGSWKNSCSTIDTLIASLSRMVFYRQESPGVNFRLYHVGQKRGLSLAEEVIAVQTITVPSQG